MIVGKSGGSLKAGLLGEGMEIMIVVTMSLRCSGRSTQRCSAESWMFQMGIQELSVRDSSKEMASGSQEKGELVRVGERAE